jgi:hypothetical protein
MLLRMKQPLLISDQIVDIGDSFRLGQRFILIGLVSGREFVVSVSTQEIRIIIKDLRLCHLKTRALTSRQKSSKG